MTTSVYTSDPTGTYVYNPHFKTAVDFIHSNTAGQQVPHKSALKCPPLIGCYGQVGLAKNRGSNLQEQHLKSSKQDEKSAENGGIVKKL